MGHNCSVFHKEGTNKQKLEEQRIVTVMGKGLEPGGVASEELVDRCRTAVRVMGEVEGGLVIPTGGDPAGTGISEAEVMRGLMMEMGIQHTVPVRCDHQVKCVPGVLSMGNDSPHMYRVRTIENKMKPWEILEEMQF